MEAAHGYDQRKKFLGFGFMTHYVDYTGDASTD